MRILVEGQKIIVESDTLSARFHGAALVSLRSSDGGAEFLHPDADVILPCVNGIIVKSNSGFPGNDRFPWPHRWNAQMVIAERDNNSKSFANVVKQR